MRSNKIEAHKRVLKLTSLQREVLVGTLLGDGCLETQSGGRMYRLKIEHSFKQKEYTDWLYDVFQDWVRTPPKKKRKTLNGMISWNYGFATYSHPALRFYGQQFYDIRRGKVVPSLIAKLLTPRAIAVWFMDDGSVKSSRHRTLLINTQSFTLKDLERLQETLRKKFKIETTRQKARGRWRLYIVSESIERFRTLIEPYLLRSMRYKLGNKLPKE